MAQVQICRGFGHEDWKDLATRLTKEAPNEEAWKRAIEVFKRRMDERFFSCIKALECADSRLKYEEIPDGPNADRPLPPEQATLPGFAIMGLCCVVIETLQSFRLGTRGGTNETLKTFLQERPAFKQDGSFGKEEIAKDFANGIRNGILHWAETRQWVIRRDQPEKQMIEPRQGRYHLNRTRFVEILTKEYQTYFAVLANTENPENSDLRKKFLRRMNGIAEEC